MAWTRLEDATFSAFTAGLMRYEDEPGTPVAIALQADRTVIGIDIETAMRFAESLVVMCDMIISGKSLDNLIPSDPTDGRKKVGKQVVENRKRLGLG